MPTTSLLGSTEPSLELAACATMYSVPSSTFKDLMQAAETEGGTFHATQQVSKRTLAVVQRKLMLLASLQSRTLAFERMTAQREDTLQGMFRGESSWCTEESSGIGTGFKQFLKSITHDGDPADADRNNFQHFVEHFGLPPRHEAVLSAQRAFHAGVHQCCVSALSTYTALASETKGDALLRVTHGAGRVLAWLKEIGAPASHDAVLELTEMSRSGRADYVVECAEGMMLKSRQGSNNHGEDALACALRLRQLVGDAVDFGVLRGDARIQRAVRVASDFRATSVLEEAKRNQELCSGVWCEASSVAAVRRVRENVADALSFGVSAQNETLLEAQRVCNDMHASVVLRTALNEKQRDEEAVISERYRDGDADARALKLGALIEEAVIGGVFRRHRDLVEALKIVHDLRYSECARRKKGVRRRGTFRADDTGAACT